MAEPFKKCEIFSHTTETEDWRLSFDTGFSDFDVIANEMKLLPNPFDSDIKTLASEVLHCHNLIIDHGFSVFGTTCVRNRWPRWSTQTI